MSTNTRIPNIPSLPGILTLYTNTTNVGTSSVIPPIPNVIPPKLNVVPSIPNVIPSKPNVIPSTLSVIPPKPNVIPSTPSVIPPIPSVIPSKLSVIPPKPNVILSKPSVIPSKASVIPPKASVIPSKPNVILPKPNVILPKPNVIPPIPSVIPSKASVIPSMTSIIPSNPSVVSSTSKLHTGKNSIISRIESLPEGKVLNVSKLQPNGTGARIMHSTKSGKYKGTKRLRIVSDNIESYMLAINMIPNGNQLYSRDIEEMGTIFGGNCNIIARNEEIFTDNYPTLDLFDFETYVEDYNLFAEYFVGVELLLRTAIWISYKYGRLDVEEREELMQEFNTKQNKYDWLENLTDVFEPRQFLYSWMKHFNPRLLENFNKISTNYQHHIGLYFNRAYRRYIDSEWVDITLWFE